MTNPTDLSAPPGAHAQPASTARQIHPAGAPPPLGRASPQPGNEGAVRPFVNDGRNSRLAASLPSGTWHARWQTDLTHGLQPALVLQAGERIVARGEGLWQLFDRQGRALAVERIDNGDIVLDAAHSLLYYPAPKGIIAASHLTDGKLAFRLNPLFGQEFERVFLARHDNRLLIASSERQTDLHAERQPDLSFVETQDLGKPAAVDDLGFLSSPKRLGSLQRDSSQMMVALHGQTLAIAIPNEILFADQDLKVTGTLTGAFTPLSMSLDEIGNVYLVVHAGGRTALWMVTPQGDRRIAFDLPSDVKENGIPPIVGYDHQVYLVLSDRLLAISPEGRSVWEHKLGNSSGGATITANDQLLVSEGSEIAAFDTQGHRVVLHAFPGETLRTPPILTQNGDLLVASDTRLHCLAR